MAAPFPVTSLLTVLVMWVDAITQSGVFTLPGPQHATPMCVDLQFLPAIIKFHLYYTHSHNLRIFSLTNVQERLSRNKEFY